MELWELFPISLVPHDPKWRWWADEEIDGLKVLLSGYSPIVSHIGSTAIPNILSKPIIDILVEVPVNSNFISMRDLLVSNGYICMSDGVNRKGFNKGYTIKGYAERVFHVHLRRLGDNDEILFRDYLVSHNDMAKEYESLKMDLLAKYGNNRDAYTEAKTDFVKEVVSCAKRDAAR